MSDQIEIPDDEIHPEYSLRGEVRGKYAERFAAGTNLVRLDPMWRPCSTSESVNRALRALADIIQERTGTAA